MRTTQTTPERLLAFAGVGVVLACASLVAQAQTGPGTPATRVAGVPELEYLPAGVALVAYADVAEVVGSELGRRFPTLRPQGQEAWRRFVEGTGIDLEADVDAILVGVLPRGERTAAVAIVRGRLDQARIEEYALGRGGVGETYQGVGVIVRQQGHRSGALAFLAPGLIATGESTAVRGAVDCLRGAANATGEPGLVERIGELAGDATLWAVGRLDRLPRGAVLPATLSTQASGVEWLSAAARLGDGMVGSLRAQTRDEESAGSLRDALRGHLDSARQQAVDNPALQTLVESLELGGTETTVELSFRLEPQLLESLAAGASRPAEP